MKYKEIKRLNALAAVEVITKYKWYTLGESNPADYKELVAYLEGVSEQETITVGTLAYIAENIAKHSEQARWLTIESIMFILNKEAVVTSYAVADH